MLAGIRLERAACLNSDTRARGLSVLRALEVTNESDINRGFVLLHAQERMGSAWPWYERFTATCVVVVLNELRGYRSLIITSASPEVSEETVDLVPRSWRLAQPLPPR